VEFYNSVIIKLVELFKKEASPTSKIGIVIKNSTQPDMPLALSYRYVEMLSAETLWELIFRVAQSNQNCDSYRQFLLEGKISALVQVLYIPRGGGKLPRGLLV
jgi:hypothetical protein